MCYNIKNKPFEVYVLFRNSELDDVNLKNFRSDQNEKETNPIDDYLHKYDFYAMLMLKQSRPTTPK